MYVYDIGYHSYEESHYFQLMHEQRFYTAQLEEVNRPHLKPVDHLGDLVDQTQPGAQPK